MGFSSLSFESRATLTSIASMAYGEGTFEGVKGGKGHIGLLNVNGDERVVRFDTNGGTSRGIGAVRAADQLRAKLIDIASQAGLGDDVLKEIRDKLGLGDKGEKPRFASLLDRKVVAKVVTLIGGDEAWADVKAGLLNPKGATSREGSFADIVSKSPAENVVGIPNGGQLKQFKAQMERRLDAFRDYIRPFFAGNGGGHPESHYVKWDEGTGGFADAGRRNIFRSSVSAAENNLVRAMLHNAILAHFDGRIPPEVRAVMTDFNRGGHPLSVKRIGLILHEVEKHAIEAGRGGNEVHGAGGGGRIVGGAVLGEDDGLPALGGINRDAFASEAAALGVFDEFAAFAEERGGSGSAYVKVFDGSGFSRGEVRLGGTQGEERYLGRGDADKAVNDKARKLFYESVERLFGGVVPDDVKHEMTNGDYAGRPLSASRIAGIVRAVRSHYEVIRRLCVNETVDRFPMLKDLFGTESGKELRNFVESTLLPELEEDGEPEPDRRARVSLVLQNLDVLANEAVKACKGCGDSKTILGEFAKTLLAKGQDACPWRDSMAENVAEGKFLVSTDHLNRITLFIRTSHEVRDIKATAERMLNGDVLRNRVKVADDDPLLKDWNWTAQDVMTADLSAFAEASFPRFRLAMLEAVDLALKEKVFDGFQIRSTRMMDSLLGGKLPEEGLTEGQRKVLGEKMAAKSVEAFVGFLLDDPNLDEKVFGGVVMGFRLNTESRKEIARTLMKTAIADHLRMNGLPEIKSPADLVAAIGTLRDVVQNEIRDLFGSAFEKDAKLVADSGFNLHGFVLPNGKGLNGDDWHLVAETLRRCGESGQALPAVNQLVADVVSSRTLAFDTVIGRPASGVEQQLFEAIRSCHPTGEANRAAGIREDVNAVLTVVDGLARRAAEAFKVDVAFAREKLLSQLVLTRSNREVLIDTLPSVSPSGLGDLKANLMQRLERYSGLQRKIEGFGNYLRGLGANVPPTDFEYGVEIFRKGGFEGFCNRNLLDFASAEKDVGKVERLLDTRIAAVDFLRQRLDSADESERMASKVMLDFVARQPGGQKADTEGYLMLYDQLRADCCPGGRIHAAFATCRQALAGTDPTVRAKAVLALAEAMADVATGHLHQKGLNQKFGIEVEGSGAEEGMMTGSDLLGAIMRNAPPELRTSIDAVMRTPAWQDVLEAKSLRDGMSGMDKADSRRMERMTVLGDWNISCFAEGVDAEYGASIGRIARVMLLDLCVRGTFGVNGKTAATIRSACEKMRRIRESNPAAFDALFAGAVVPSDFLKAVSAVLRDPHCALARDQYPSLETVTWIDRFTFLSTLLDSTQMTASNTNIGGEEILATIPDRIIDGFLDISDEQVDQLRNEPQTRRALVAKIIWGTEFRKGRLPPFSDKALNGMSVSEFREALFGVDRARTPMPMEASIASAFRKDFRNELKWINDTFYKPFGEKLLESDIRRFEDDICEASLVKAGGTYHTWAKYDEVVGAQRQLIENFKTAMKSFGNDSHSFLVLRRTLFEECRMNVLYKGASPSVEDIKGDLKKREQKLKTFDTLGQLGYSRDYIDYLKDAFVNNRLTLKFMHYVTAVDGFVERNGKVLVEDALALFKKYENEGASEGDLAMELTAFTQKALDQLAGWIPHDKLEGENEKDREIVKSGFPTLDQKIGVQDVSYLKSFLFEALRKFDTTGRLSKAIADCRPALITAMFLAYGQVQHAAAYGAVKFRSPEEGEFDEFRLKQENWQEGVRANRVAKNVSEDYMFDVLPIGALALLLADLTMMGAGKYWLQTK